MFTVIYSSLYEYYSICLHCKKESWYTLIFTSSQVNGLTTADCSCSVCVIPLQLPCCCYTAVCSCTAPATHYIHPPPPNPFLPPTLRQLRVEMKSKFSRNLFSVSRQWDKITIFCIFQYCNVLPVKILWNFNENVFVSPLASRYEYVHCTYVFIFFRGDILRFLKTSNFTKTGLYS